MIIDFHTHTFPDKIAAAAIGKLQQASHSHAFTNGTVSVLQNSMQQAGIDWSVVLPVATNPIKVASMNDLAAKLTGQEGLIYFGCIHPEMDNAEGEIARIAQLGLQGIKIHPVYQNVDIDDVRYLRILDAAGQNGLIVVMHSGDDIGFPGVVRCSPEMTACALKQVGPVQLICAHMGGWRNWERVTDSLEGTSAMLDTAFSLGAITPLGDNYYTPEQLPMLQEEAFCQLIHAFGSKRVVFGTDSPWDDQFASVKAITALPLTTEEKQAILGGNAAKMLGLNG